MTTKAELERNLKAQREAEEFSQKVIAAAARAKDSKPQQVKK